ncbi:dUTP diphosphatase [Sporosarcina limicola]|uniref:Dimeric dUTPase (All-alpha-NTP-PPase superfamily) n=1 Tax=Sporosarcina limicola TaxID=34101 RepID=A0A927RCJ5_9BACL|nr:dUTP diphosphatase [Sporosarcina limicola]MBE1554430.1 dimeric dUTPase (all-alpha-NTP-PPase superfamily) [Sporosarcina limicola]
MQLTKLFSMQSKLDSFIQNNRDKQTGVFEEKGLALLIELAELANETRCFKFWSLKGPSDDAVILEEYVDSIHFLLSLGIEKGFDTLVKWPEGKVEGDLTQLFLKTTGVIHSFLLELTMDAYKQIWIHYGAIAEKLGFSNEDIINAYIKKNEENYDRQKTGY